MALPVMLRYGYDKKLATGVVASGGTLGIIIPPSIMLVIMADQSGESVGRLFAGALLPGLLLSVLYFLYVLIRTCCSRSWPRHCRRKSAIATRPGRSSA